MYVKLTSLIPSVRAFTSKVANFATIMTGPATHKTKILEHNLMLFQINTEMLEFLDRTRE